MRTFCLLPLLLTVGCSYTVKVEPIHLTVDVNIKIDRALDEFFASPAPAPAPAPTPAPSPTLSTPAPAVQAPAAPVK
jgi:hypothetical protein